MRNFELQHSDGEAVRNLIGRVAMIETVEIRVRADVAAVWGNSKK